jgi:menaquinol-cytochrome c reductase iron-sulfur subunit
MSDESFTSNDGQPVRRRAALGRIAVGIGGLWTLLSGAVAVAFAGTPLRRSATTQDVAIGKTNQFSDSFRRVQFESATGSGWYATNERNTVFVRLDADNKPIVFSGTCTHLGCTVRWEAGENEFICPCHGGRYAADGSVISGPPPSPLRQLTANVKDEQVVVEINGAHG